MTDCLTEGFDGVFAVSLDVGLTVGLEDGFVADSFLAADFDESFGIVSVKQSLQLLHVYFAVPEALDVAFFDIFLTYT